MTIEKVMAAISNKKYDKALELITKDKKLLNSTEDNLTPLLKAFSIDKFSTKFIDQLINLGAHVNIKNQNDQTPLILAIQQNKYILAEKILELTNLETVNAIDCTKLTALNYAINHNNERLVLLLLKKGIDTTNTTIEEIPQSVINFIAYKNIDDTKKTEDKKQKGKLAYNLGKHFEDAALMEDALKYYRIGKSLNDTSCIARLIQYDYEQKEIEIKKLYDAFKNNNEKYLVDESKNKQNLPALYYLAKHYGDKRSLHPRRQLCLFAQTYLFTALEEKASVHFSLSPSSVKKMHDDAKSTLEKYAKEKNKDQELAKLLLLSVSHEQMQLCTDPDEVIMPFLKQMNDKLYKEYKTSTSNALNMTKQERHDWKEKSLTTHITTFSSQPLTNQTNDYNKLDEDEQKTLIKNARL